MIHVTLFTAAGEVRSGGEELLAAAPPPGGALWIDLEGRDERFEGWMRDWGFHRLAIEDTFTLQHHPRVEQYGETVFLIVRGLDFNVMKDPVADDVRTLKLAAFLENGRLVTFHRAPLRSVRAVRERLEAGERALPGGMAQLLWSVCSEMMEHYVPVIERVGDQIEELETAVVTQPRREQMQRVLGLRRRLADLRRTILPLRQVFSHLASTRSIAIDDVASLHFRDVQDTVQRLADAVEQQRDLLNNVKDTYLSVVAQRTNDVMRVLTVFSAIVLPLSLVAGIYGMNFQHMPELARPWAYPAVLLAMAGIAGGMLFWFRRKGWL